MKKILAAVFISAALMLAACTEKSEKTPVPSSGIDSAPVSTAGQNADTEPEYGSWVSCDFSDRGGPVITMAMDTATFEEYVPELGDWGFRRTDGSFEVFMEISYVPQGDAGILAASLAESYDEGITSIEDKDTMMFGDRHTARHVTSTASQGQAYDAYSIAIEGGAVTVIIGHSLLSSQADELTLLQFAQTLTYEFL